MSRERRELGRLRQPAYADLELDPLAITQETVKAPTVLVQARGQVGHAPARRAGSRRIPAQRCARQGLRERKRGPVFLKDSVDVLAFALM